MRTFLLLGIIALFAPNRGSGVEEFILFVTPDQLRAAGQDRIVGPREEKISGKIINVFGTGDLKLAGDHNTIILAMAGRVSVAGNSNRIFARKTSRVSLEGATNEVTHEDNVVLADRGVGSLLKQVGKIVLKIGSPASGSDASSFAVVGEPTPKPGVEPQPGPAKVVEGSQPEVASLPTPASAMIPAITAGVGQSTDPKQPLPPTALASMPKAPAASTNPIGSQPPGGEVGSLPTGVPMAASRDSGPSGVVEVRPDPLRGASITNPPPPSTALGGSAAPSGPLPLPVVGAAQASGADSPAAGSASMAANKVGGSEVAPIGGGTAPMSAGEKQKWDDALSLIGKIAPSVIELINKLPGAVEAAAVAPNSAVAVIGQEIAIDPVLIGTWDIESVSTSDAMLTLFSLKMSGSFQFNEDGSGFMKANLGVKGISLDRSASFLWAATPGVLTMNRGLGNESQWERTKLESGAQEAKITTEDGTELVLKLTKPSIP